MARSLDDATRDFGAAMAELVKKYQFRDRNETVAYGVSVSGAYALRALDQHGPLTMGALAAELHVTVSTASRVVDQLVGQGLVRRRQDADDRRVWRVEPSAAGRRIWSRIAAELHAIDREILASLSPSEREAVLRAVRALGEATERWRAAKRAEGA